MLETIKWEAEKRKDMTKGEMKTARKSGLVPCNINLKGEDSVQIMMNTLDIEKRPFGNFRIELKVKGIKDPFDCFLKDIQYNYNSDIIHVDFQGLTVGQEVDIDVAFELIGESVGVKQGGILNTGVSSVKIRTLPRNMPNSIQVDISELKIGDSIGITDVKLSEDHTLLEPTEGVVVSILAPKTEEEAEADLVPGEMAEPEILTEKSSEE